MPKKLYVGNLPYSLKSGELEQLFSPYGNVESADVIMDRETGRSRGFGFVEMQTDEEAAAAIRELNGRDVEGRALVVNEAREREPRRGGGREGGGRYGGGGRRDDRRGPGGYSRGR
ncbi:MAG: RNA-binding protein [Actinomycetota bacterium]|nr:RNA-binding protein [Actinomycetota bacterium]